MRGRRPSQGHRPGAGDSRRPAGRTLSVSVVGAGVIGLTAAIELQRAGHDVQVIAERLRDETTSAVAGAIWFPYRAGPPDRVARWGQRTRARLEQLARTPDAGVDLLDVIELDPDPEPWWLAAIPDAQRAQVPRTFPQVPRTFAWRFRAPRVEPARFLAWLEGQLERPIRRARVERLDEVPGDVVVCAAGLGARRLADDPTVEGVAGQVVIAEPGAIDLATSIADDTRAPMFYAIPRRAEVVLGGTADPHAGDEPPPPAAAVTARILADARRMGLAPGAITRVRTGLRPCRPEVRLERAGRIVHCYGHGGAGYTLCLGCAEDVAALVSG